MATEASTGFMSVERAAAELETTPLAIQRLIARERLAAVQLGAGGPWRIAGSELGRFISGGCPDLKMPSIHGEWFNPDDTAMAAAEFQKYFIAAAERGIGNTPPAGDGPFEIKALTPAMQSAMTDAPARRFIARKDAPTFVDAFHAWGVDRIRQLMAGQLNKTGRRMLPELYRSPDAYAQHTADAVKTMLQSRISFTKLFEGTYQSAQYYVPLSIMMTTTFRTQIRQTAF